MTTDAEQKVSLTIDGRPVSASAGELIIDAAERAGIFIPRFCYHPRMSPVGMCRMCLVEVSGPRGFSLLPACFFSVQEGQEVRTDSEKARKAQEGVLEFLLINHPLDCPVCDKGGECPLQDQALSYGPGESRYEEEKRHWAKPIEIGPLVLLDRERCIQCARCTRFAEEVAGEAMINLAFRADGVEVATFPGSPFTSYFAGNTIQICPVGALTSPAYRFRSRPWDLEQVETTCTSCAVGCRMAAQSSAGRLVRHLGIDSDPVNQSWLCDRGRYGFEAIYARSRLSQPLLQRGDELRPASWHEAIGEIAAHISSSIEKSGPESIGFIGGARLSNEDAYAFAKLAKSIVGTDSIDAQLGDGLPVEIVLGLPQATIDDATRARVVVTLAGDLHEELPILHLRLRLAALAGLSIVECATGMTGLGSIASERLDYLPGDSASVAAALAGQAAEPPSGIDLADVDRVRDLIGTGDGVVFIVGRPNLAESAEAVAAAATTLHGAFPSARFLFALRRANTRGALDMGLSPGMLPGRVTLDAGRNWFADTWGELPKERGRDAQAMLAAAVNGELSVLVLLGADPLSDFPDRALARAAIEQCPFVVFVGTHENPSSALAHVVLPVAGDGERGGTTTNIEGRVTRLAAKVTAPGLCWPAWSVAAEISRRLGTPFGFDGVEEISKEVSEVAPAYRGVDADLVGRPAWRDGIVVPLPRTPVTISPRPIDPIATPGILSTEEQGAPLSTGTGLPLGAELNEKRRVDADGSSSPPLFSFEGRVDFASPVPPSDGAYRLVIRRALYDRGSLVEANPSFAPFVAAPTAFVHRATLENVGAEEGGDLRLVSPSGAVVLPVGVDDSLPRQVVAVTANLGEPGEAGVMALVDSSRAAVDVTLERI